MSDFLELQTRLLDYADTTSAAALNQAKRAINDAIRWANRQYKFKFAEGIVAITYPADTLYIDIDVVCNTQVLSLITVQQLGTITETGGLVLPILDYARLQMRRFKHDQVKGEHEYDDERYLTETIKEHHIFTLGRGFGLYPTPTDDVALFIHFNEMLAPLVADADTNFFAQYLTDLIVSKALQSSFRMFLSAEKREALDPLVVEAEWASAIAWDKQVRDQENFFPNM